ncbi:MAG: 4-hydroxy-tetrahydrodipicolinate synthase [Arthrobacter sp.]|nr:4-hydroxy-tetrahydrodipicolinate synthase [Arthrobacter sp.]
MIKEMCTVDTDEFGTVLTAMVTPFDDEGELDRDGIQGLVGWLIRDGWNDGIVVNGTTGESFATTDREKAEVISGAARAAKGRAKIVAGVGAADTRHSVALAEMAAGLGADGLLVVAPYYCRPTQKGLIQHFRAVADATPLPVMLYDIPKRTGTAIEAETIVTLAEHPRIVAVKDAKGDLISTSWVLKRTELAYYSGDDALNLPLLSVGASGFVSVVGHVAANLLRTLLDHYRNGNVVEALAIHRDLLSIYTGMFRCPGSASAKAALRSLGLPGGPVRSPLVDLSAAEYELLLADLMACTAYAAQMGRNQPTHLPA